jgi:hypothetical protein
MAAERNCGNCRYGLKPMSYPQCLAEKCDEDYSNWTPDAEGESKAPESGAMVDGGTSDEQVIFRQAGVYHFPC